MTRAESHPSLETMESYLEESLPDFEQSALEDHVAGCAECMGTLERMEGLLFSGFNARAHAAAIASEEVEADPLARALRMAQQQFGRYASALKAWLDSAEALWNEMPARAWGESGVVPVHSFDDRPLTVALERGERRAEISVHRERMTVVVKVEGGNNDLVVLFPREGGGLVLAAAFESGDKESQVTFAEVPSGEYLLAVAPAGV